MYLISSLRTLLAAGLAVGIAGVASADSISPDSYTNNDLAVGDSVTIEKTVVVSETPTSALIDVHFLFDTSGSMGARIDGVKAAAVNIFNGLDGLGDVAASVGVYSEAARLAPDGTVPGRVINQDVTTNSATAIAAINAVTLSNPDNGGDGPENGVTGVELATENLSWRPGSNRFMFVFGDIGFKTGAASEGALAGITYDTGFTPFGEGNDDQDGAPISTVADATAALTADSVKLFGFGPDGDFASAIGTLGGTFKSSGTDPATIVTDIINSVTGSFASYSEVTVDALGGGLPEIGVTTVCTGADIGDCDGAVAKGAYNRSVDRTFTFEVTFTRLAAGDKSFSTFALVDGGSVATEADKFGGAVIPTPAALPLLLSAFGGLMLFRRRNAA